MINKDKKCYTQKASFLKHELNNIDWTHLFCKQKKISDTFEKLNEMRTMAVPLIAELNYLGANANSMSNLTPSWKFMSIIDYFYFLE